MDGTRLTSVVSEMVDPCASGQNAALLDHTKQNLFWRCVAQLLWQFPVSCVIPHCRLLTYSSSFVQVSSDLDSYCSPKLFRDRQNS